MAELRSLYQQAFDLFVAGKYDESVAAYQRVLAADARFALAYQGLAEVYSRLNQMDDAIATIRKAIECDPDEALFHTSLSRFLQRQGKIPEAEEAAAVAARKNARR
ncbi:MAG TPA: tetratricopeptide repeat protein [Myxococcota bacterium]|nr:tetratricopeptide repeat protein [Myxococcota bacterium]